MGNERNIIATAIDALEEAYKDYSTGKGLEYTLGYMDALAVLRSMKNTPAMAARHFNLPPNREVRA